MSDRKWHWLLLFLVLTVLVGSAGCTSSAAALLPERREVWQRPQGQADREVTSQARASKGDRVWTQQQGQALLKWPDLWVRLYGDTNMSMEEVVPTNVRLSVDAGTSLNGGLPRASQRINLTTAYAEITFTGTIVMVAYHPGTRFTMVRVFAGQVEVRNLTGVTQTRLVGTREWALVRPGEPPDVSYRLEDMRALARDLGLWDAFHQVELDVEQGFGPAASRIAPGDVDVIFIGPACAPGVLYCENLDDGRADGWDLAPGWKVGLEGANYVLAGSEHHWATLTGQEWDDYRLRFRLKLLRGVVHLNYRLTEGPIRYFIGFHQDGLYLSKQIRDTFTDLAAVDLPHALNRWYQVEIVGWGGHLQIYVDGKLELDYMDRAPLRRGSIAFETQDDSQVLVDDIEVLPPGPESPPPPPAGTPTPTRTPLLRPTPTRTPTWLPTPTPTRTPTRGPTSTPTATPDTTGPTIANVTASASRIGWPPPYCTPNEVTVSATIRDVAGVSGVKLTYRVVEGTRQGSWQALEMRQRATDTYAGTIGDAELRASLNPPVQLTATLEYYVQAFDGRGNRSQSSTGTVKVEYCLY